MSPTPGVSEEDRRAHLETAELEVVGRFADASNATLLVRLRAPGGVWPELPVDDAGGLAIADLPADGFGVWKPRLGEAPLWDFPDGTLHRREVAAYEVDRLLGTGLVPLTVVRGDDVPHGPGALQRFVPHDPQAHYFTLLERGDDAVVAQLRAMVVLDLVLDNADRKGGHVLLEGDRVRLVDHGVCFHPEPHLRTVAWHFAGEPVPEELRSPVARLADLLAGRDPATDALRDLLDDVEVTRLRERCEEVAGLERFPAPAGPRSTPWPLL
ncbi:MAG: SCO1664 family protein [Actinomycetes bacterium]